MNKKTRRHSGRYTPDIIKPKMKYNEIKEDALEPQENYDDWIEKRDGFRDEEYFNWKKEDKKKRNKKRRIFIGGKRK